MRVGVHEWYVVTYAPGGRTMTASRITITLPADLVERIDQASSNRSRFIAEAAERELHHRLREALRSSLDAPHEEGRKVAELGLAGYRDALPEDVPELMDPAAAVDLTWHEGEGWRSVGDP